MRHKLLPIVLLLLFVFLAAAAPGLAADVDRAVCAVCGPREGSGFEPVEATAVWRGRTYYFCSVECKVEFLKDPNAFLVTDAGTPAPPFSLPAFTGKPVALESLRGKVVLLDFWATFCKPCMEALPELQRLHATHGARGFTVVGLTVDDRPKLVSKAIAKAKVGYPMLRATPEVWNAYKVNALPALVLVGRDGRIVRRFGGEADPKILVAEIERALEAEAPK